MSTPPAQLDPGEDSSPLVEARGLVKTFDAVRALDGLDVSIRRGEVTAIVGDNGAGKSTLVRCLTGVHLPDQGEIRFEGRPVRLGSPDAARRLGVETVYQDLGLIDDLEVWQNLYLNREICRPIPLVKVLDRRTMRARASEILADLDVNVPNVRATVRRMSGGQRQSIAIARAVSWGKTLVVMDEPTAALGVRETRAVERLIDKLRANKVTVVLISHDLTQVQRVSDTVAVLRRGRVVAQRRAEQTDGDELVGLITGAIGGDDHD